MDTDGNAKIAPPPPVKDSLTELIQLIGNRSLEIWLIAGLVLATVVSMLLNLVFLVVSYIKKKSHCTFFLTQATIWAIFILPNDLIF